MAMIKKTLIAALMAAFSCASLSAHAALFGDDEARRAILDVRTKVDTLQQSKADNSAVLELSNQNDQLRQEIARLNGQIEVLSNEVANIQQRQKDFYVDLDNRLRKLEPQVVAVDGKDATVELSEQRTYDNALALFKAGDYKKSGAAFADFLQRYPQSAYAPSAQYWIGNAYYAQRDYKNAIAAQQALLKKYPGNPKGADALLNIASSYTELKDKSAAKKTLESLVAQYPNTPSAQTAKERLANFK
ncbi:MAG: tol-pal system protein YbgF [Herminiimonas sp.]|jgi:tol-pal system protein YbgF|uniref:tol-pal system protein YbgF n=1 Tax=Herminiimonas sp. TaxID=1926289 RepID=UPI0027257FAD|nr:tol-pal system protein YbgF [Herminiimonas sp.]MDO9419932.1 tol-pal system protein YbgF [Herminiimonas sp.]